MSNYNRVILMGFLTYDPEMKYTSNGKAVTNIRMAINNSYTTKAGEKKNDATFLNITAWGKLGENCAEYLSKGSHIHVEGRLQSDFWETENGNKKSAIKIIADKIAFLSTKKGKDKPINQQTNQENDIPF